MQTVGGAARRLSKTAAMPMMISRLSDADSKTGSPSGSASIPSPRRKDPAVSRDPEKRRECARRYREANPEKERERRRRWREANPEKRREYQRRWQEANRDGQAAAARARRAANRAAMHGAKTAARQAEKRPANPDAARAARQARRRERYRTDPAYRARVLAQQAEKRRTDPDAARARRRAWPGYQRSKQANTASVDSARRHYYMWTGPELEVANRADLALRPDD